LNSDFQIIGVWEKKKKNLAIFCYSQHGDDPQEESLEFKNIISLLLKFKGLCRTLFGAPISI